MLQKIINRILKPRHFWRQVSFDELSEIYASMFLRSLALNIIGIFVPIYLYKIGYSLQDIFLWFFVWFVSRFFYSFVAARLVAKIGPKHTIAFATVLHIVYLTLLLTIKDLHWPLLSTALLGSFATVLFVVAFEVDFSKVQHSEHGGKELGYEQIFERIGAIVGPIIGGLIATFIDPRYTIALAIVVLCGSLIPIFMSAEPTHIHQHIKLSGFPWRRHKRDFISSAAVSIENIVSMFVWPIFIAVTVLTKDTFAVLGVLAAAGTCLALLSIHTIGKMIDERKGGLLLKVGVIVNAILHLFRPFVTSVGQILAINLVNEPTTAAYRMPYLKGRYDAADSVPGYRIVYFMITDMVLSVSDAIFWLCLWIGSLIISPTTVMQWSFVVAAIASLLILTQRFAALRT